MNNFNKVVDFLNCETDKDELNSDTIIPAKIKVIGVGGGGGNAVNRMINAGLTGVEFYLMNTDAQVLKFGAAPTSNKIRLGPKSTKGLGAGGNPDIGEAAAVESQQEIAAAIEGADMVFITAGMGGGTGTGAAPIIAKVAKEMDILTIAVVTRPFKMELSRKEKLANQGIEKLKEVVDAIIVIPNENLLNLAEKNLTLIESFAIVDEVLLRGVQGITDIITIPGLINVDFADVRAVMKASGSAWMGIGIAQGEGKAEAAAKNAIESKLLETTINGAKGIIVNITGGPDLSLSDVTKAMSIIDEAVQEDASVILGSVTDENLQGTIKITVIATGFESKPHNSVLNEGIKTKQLSAVDFFSGAFSNLPKKYDTTIKNTSKSLDIDIPDFLKK